MHLRWELYPVPHEKGRAKYGGSRLEEFEWWTKKQGKDSLAKLWFMIPEILLLKGVWEHNRPLWFGSWTLHFGLYLLIGNMALLLLAGALALGGVTADAALYALLLQVIRYVALIGAALGTVGALVMLYRRLFDPKLRMYNLPSHFFNLIHLGTIYVAGLIWFLTDAEFVAKLVSLYSGLISASGSIALPTAAYVHVAVILLFFVYLPFTHMTHFFTKWFTWHTVRWEDEPNRPGGRLEKKIAGLVSQPVTWAAPHVMADGKHTWLDLVSMTGTETEKGND